MRAVGSIQTQCRFNQFGLPAHGSTVAFAPDVAPLPNGKASGTVQMVLLARHQAD